MGREIELDLVSDALGEEEKKKMVEINLRVIGPSPPSRLLVPSSIKVHDLRKMIAKNRHLPIEALKLVLQGRVLHDTQNGDDQTIQFNNGDSLIIAVKPKSPPKHIRDEFDDDDDDLKFHLPQSSSRWKMRLFSILRDKLKLPDMLLMAIFSISCKMWAIIVMWFILAPVAHRFGIGPLYDTQLIFHCIIVYICRYSGQDLGLYSIILDIGSRGNSVHTLYSTRISESFPELLMLTTSTETFEQVGSELPYFSPRNNPSQC